jgi:hypothetical protein
MHTLAVGRSIPEDPVDNELQLLVRVRRQGTSCTNKQNYVGVKFYDRRVKRAAVPVEDISAKMR